MQAFYSLTRVARRWPATSKPRSSARTSAWTVGCTVMLSPMSGIASAWAWYSSSKAAKRFGTDRKGRSLVRQLVIDTMAHLAANETFVEP
eukprot:scaffold3190_cov409-Prasinococcus_capsulatus_cf.AAC.26